MLGAQTEEILESCVKEYQKNFPFICSRTKFEAVINSRKAIAEAIIGRLFGVL